MGSLPSSSNDVGAKVATAELPNWIDHDASPALREVRTSKGPPADEYHRGAFGFAIQARGSRIERLFCNIYDLTPERVGVFDLVFCASVLLHLTDPLARALRHPRRVCGREAIICTGHRHARARSARGIRALRRDGRRPCLLVPDHDLSRADGVAAGFSRVERVSTFPLQSADGRFDTPHGTLRAFVD